METLKEVSCSTKKQVDFSSNSVNHEIAIYQSLDAFKLVESYKNGELKDGKLKEIATKLEDEDNPVIMLMKHKKN